MSIRLFVLLLVTALAATPAYSAFTQQCQWGATAPAVHGKSWNVIHTPVVLNLLGPNHGFAHVAFVSYETTTHLNQDGGGVLRVMDRNCVEVARFPDCPFPPVANQPLNFGTTPDLGPVSGIAAGDLDGDGRPEIVAVIGGGSTQHRQLAAFNLQGSCLRPKWVSPDVLPASDAIRPAAPAIVQLDRPGTVMSPPWHHAEIVIDNKVYDANGALRFNGSAASSLSCGGGPCPRSRTAIVAALPNHVLPWIITGAGNYRSQLGSKWTPGWGVNLIPNMSKGGLTYPAVAELDPSSPGPEIVVVDTVGTTASPVGSLSVLRSSGALLAKINVANAQCGGPPMMGNADGVPGPEIGVATCQEYALYRYNWVPKTITPVWTQTAPYDASGQTTSTLYNDPNGARIVYADETKLYILNGATGAVIQQIANSSATAFEGPVIASFVTASPNATCRRGKGSIIVAANDSGGGADHGVRIFADPAEINDVASCWNQHAFHVTNVSTGFGTIPQVEPPSWATAPPARNTYRVQAWP